MLYTLKKTWAFLQISQEYQRNFAQYGCTPKGVHWRNQESQLLRFELLLQIIKPEHRKESFSLFDFGCGYGALFEFIKNKAIMRNSSYIGYEANPTIYRMALKNIRDARVQFIQKNEPTTISDYGLISGTFNLKMNATNPFWWQYIQKMLTKCWNHTTHGLAFNLLDYHKSQAPHHKLFYCDPKQVIQFCRTNLTETVYWKEDSRLPDIHFYLYK